MDRELFGVGTFPETLCVRKHGLLTQPFAAELDSPTPSTPLPSNST